MSTNADVLKAASFTNIDTMIGAAQTAGLPLWIAAAFVEIESHGANVYGHDAGGLNAGAAVTPDNYSKFYDRVVNQHAASNGVGPMQITWPGFLVDAKNRGIDLSNPAQNFIYGFRLIAGYLAGNYTTASISAAGTRYNGGAAYGQYVASRAAYWHGKLVATVAPSATVLRLGVVSNAVRSLQNGLNRVFPAYSHLVVDGKFGPETEKVIEQAEARFGVQVDGVVGPVMRAKLNSVGITF